MSKTPFPTLLSLAGASLLLAAGGLFPLTAAAPVQVAPRATGATPTRPFGSHLQTYANGTILPCLPQASLDAAASSFYNQWKASYLVAGCGTGRYYVSSTGGGQITLSEGHGYGMTLVALMAGFDPDAQTIFNGMYAFFRDHPSSGDPDLMGWQQVTGCLNSSSGEYSATDGDLDIALALLMADRQWGSLGAINYRAEALKVIQAILDHETDATDHTVLLGNFAIPGNSLYAGTRSSDFMPEHFRAFGAALNPTAWQAIVDKTYAIVAAMQKNYSPATGLLPEFIDQAATNPVPAQPGFLGSSAPQDYGYNACRDPWRLSLDYLLYGEPRAKTAVQAMTNWIRTSTGGDPRKIMAGYALDGTAVGSEANALAFTAPFAVAAMLDSSNWVWLNALYDDVVATPFSTTNYYGTTIKALTLVVLSGNYWKP